jgi:iron complex outermembrane receptor protein
MRRLTAYFKIDNLATAIRLPAPQANLSFAINPALYDVLGRVYRAGLRYNF